MSINLAENELFNDLRLRGIKLEAAGDNIKVIPVGRDVLTNEDRARLHASKTVLLPALKEADTDWAFGFAVFFSENTGFVWMHDPTEGEWHEGPSGDLSEELLEQARETSLRRVDLIRAVS